MRLARPIAFVVFLLTALPALAGPAYILVDVNSGTVLANRDAGDLWYPASVTKLMTSYVTFRALKSGRITLDSMVTVSAHALAEPPSKMGFPVGTAINFDNALKMMLVHSSNDIAMAIAETVGGNEQRFVAMMNAEAARLGMNSTRFDNPNGLPDESQHTTARDLAVLARAIWVEFPEYRSYFSIPAIKSGRRVLRSQNILLERYHGTNGMKTGFICSSGFNMVVTATRNGRTLLVVVLGANTPILRAETAAKLLDQGFQGLAGGPKAALASFHAGQTAGNPVDLHDQICGRRPKQNEDDPALIASSDADFVPRAALRPDAAGRRLHRPDQGRCRRQARTGGEARRRQDRDRRRSGSSGGEARRQGRGPGRDRRSRPRHPAATAAPARPDGRRCECRVAGADALGEKGRPAPGFASWRPRFDAAVQSADGLTIRRN